MAKTQMMTLNRSAKNGQFVSEKFTQTHPSTTVTEHRPVTKKPR